jgi:hypothetical protein
MKLTELIRQNDIKCTDGEVFDDSPESFKVREIFPEIFLTASSRF